MIDVVKPAFRRQMRLAIKRGLQFHFTYEEWCLWWLKQLGPDWIKLRGNKKRHFVMARKKDKGHYHPNNVECITHEQNCRDQATNGLAGFKKGQGISGIGRPHQNGIKITPIIARKIYRETGTQKAIAAKYKVSERLVRLIKHKQVWCTALSDEV